MPPPPRIPPVARVGLGRLGPAAKPAAPPRAAPTAIVTPPARPGATVRITRPAAPAPAAPAPAVIVVASARASSVVEPLPNVAAMSAEQLIIDVHRRLSRVRHEFHAIGLLLEELRQDRRYRRELGFATFEAMLVAKDLPSRMTALKYAVASRVPASLALAIGVERSYALARFAEKKNQPLEKLALPGAKLFGRPVIELRASMIHAALRGVPPGALTGAAAKAALDDARDAARALRAALRRAGVAAKITADIDDDTGRARVLVALDAIEARELVSLVKE